MKKFIAFLFIIALLVPQVFAIQPTSYNSASYEVASSKLDKLQIMEPETWGNLSIYSEEPLYNLNNEIIGYLYILKSPIKQGYIITRKGSNNNYIYMEASSDSLSPYSEANGKNIYLGPLHYFSTTNNIILTDLTTKDTYYSYELHDTVTTSDIDTAYSLSMMSTFEEESFTYLLGIDKETDFPSLNQNLFPKVTVVLPAAANAIRYANLERGLTFKNGTYYDTSTYGAPYNELSYSTMGTVPMTTTGYKMLIALMGIEMKTTPGRKEGATFDTDVAPGLENFFTKYTNLKVWVKYMPNDGTTNLSFDHYKSYIDAGYPVLLTVGVDFSNYDSAVSGPHTITGFGYSSDGDICFSDPWGTSSTINSGTRVSLNYNYVAANKKTIYAGYRVTLN